MKLRFVILMLFFVLPACRREESANTQSFLINNTRSHIITVIPYYQGFVVEEDSVQINSRQLKLVLDKNGRGKGTGFSYPLYLAIYDSVVVVFDHSIKVVHYSYATSNMASDSKSIKYNDSRSLYNEGNYVREITMETKQFISNRYTFTFTEQDYLNEKSN